MFGLKPVASVLIVFIFTSLFAGYDFKNIMNRYFGKNYTALSELISSSHYDENSLKIMKEEKTENIRSLSEKKNIEAAPESFTYTVEVYSFHRPKNYGDAIREENVANFESGFKSLKYTNEIDNIDRPDNYAQDFRKAEDDDNVSKREKVTNFKSDLKSFQYTNKVDSFDQFENYGRYIREAEDDDDDDEPNILCPEMKSVPPSLPPQKPAKMVTKYPDINDEEHNSLPSVPNNYTEDETWEKEPKEDKLEEKPEVNEWDVNPEKDKIHWNQEENETDENPEKYQIDGNQDAKNVNENQEEEKWRPVQVQDKLGDNVEDQPIRTSYEVEKENTYERKSWENTLRVCLGFGNDPLIKIVINGARNCKNSKDINEPLKISKRKDDYDYAAQSPSGVDDSPTIYDFATL